MCIIKSIFACIFLCFPAFFAASDVLRPHDVNQEAPDNVPVEVTYDSRGDQDSRRSPAISLTLSWNTFLGGISADMINGIAADPLGNIYVAGCSAMTWGSPIRAHSDQMDAFVAKLDADGNLLWNTFLGGTQSDWGRDIAVDQLGSVYVVGYSDGTWGSPVRAFSGSNDDVFVAKLNTYGMLQWNTFLGGTDMDVGYGLAVDSLGNVYTAGRSGAAWGPPIRSFSGYFDAFVAKLNPSGVLRWNTFLGAAGDDGGYGIAVDEIGNIYVSGWSYTTWGSPIRQHSGYLADSFVAKIYTFGNLAWNTFLGGGPYSDYSFGVAVDAIGNIYASGSSNSTWGSPIRAFSGFRDAFVVKLNSSGMLSWNTFWGGANNDEGYGIAVDANADVYITGKNEAAWNSPDNAFVVKVDASGNLLSSTLLGGAADDLGEDIAVDTIGNIYVGGYSVATWGTPIRAFAGYDDGFVAKIKERCSLTITSALHGTTNPAPGTYFYDANSTASVSAIPDGGYVLDKWTGDVPAGQETSATVSILMDAKKSIRANFKAGYSLTIASGSHGTTNPAPGTHSYGAGSTASVSAIADSGYAIEKWTGDVPAGQETSATVSILMNANKSIQANFRAVYAPSNLTAVRLTNRSLTQTESIVDLTWAVNPDNAGLNITTYRVYQMSGDSWVKLADMTSNEMTYRVRNVPKAEQMFGVTSVTDGGAESPKTTVVK